MLPTNEMASTSGWVNSVFTASASPCTTLHTPSGNPARCTSSASSSDADGSFSDGFSRNAFPHASALASIHSGTITGKLNGVIPATTPTGCNTVCTSTPLDTSELCAALQEVRHAARELDAVEAARDLAPRRRRAPCRARW